MSQSDYLALKKAQVILKNQKLPAVLPPTLYTSFASYNLETSVPNTKNIYSRLLPSGKTNIYKMEKSIVNCPTFAMCVNTNQRPNRVLNSKYNPDPVNKFPVNPKIHKFSTCTFKNGFVTRKCICTKKICKCGTNYCGSTKPHGISGHFSYNNLGA